MSQYIPDKFEPIARAIMQMAENRLWGTHGYYANMDLIVSKFQRNDDGSYDIDFRQARDKYNSVLLYGIRPEETPEGMKWGDPRILDRKPLGSFTTNVNNSTGTEPLPQTFSRSKEEISSESDTAGGSVSVSVKTSAELGGDVYGGKVGVEVENSLQASYSKEFLNSKAITEGYSTDLIAGPGEKCKFIVNLYRQDTRTSCQSFAKMTFGIILGKHKSHRWQGKKNKNWANWGNVDQFIEAFEGRAPDNVPLAGAFRSYRAASWRKQDFYNRFPKIHYQSYATQKGALAADVTRIVLSTNEDMLK